MGKDYLFSLVGVVILVISPAWADEVTFTTYYPAPAGVYNQMQANRMAVGDTNEDEQLTAADLPNRDGDIRLKPQASDPTIWVRQTGGSAGNMLYLTCPWGSDYSAGANKGWGNQCGADGLTCCVPASCPSGWTSVATFAQSLSVACSGIAECDWASTAGGQSATHPVAVGRTVRICEKD